MEAMEMVTPFIRQFMLVDSIVELIDAETRTVKAVAPGEILDFNIQVGDPVTPGGVAEVALQTGKQQILTRDSSAYGKPYIAVATPLFEDDQLVGVLTVGYSTAQREQLQHMAENLLAFIQQFSITMEQVTGAAEQLSVANDHVMNQSRSLISQVEDTGKIIDFVKGLSTNTKILGINASIEAARVGVEGRGFAVVANEIQKLANHTQESAVSIEATLEEVQNVYQKISEDLGDTHESTAQQMKALEELNLEIERLTNLSQQLLDISRTVQM